MAATYHRLQVVDEECPPDNHLRVLIFSPAFYPKVDGVALRVRHLLSNLKRMGHEVTMLCAYQEAPDSYEGIPIIKLPAFTAPMYKETKLAYPFPMFTLMKVFSEVRPDIVHFVGPEFILGAFLPVCRLYGVPILASYHWYLTAWLQNQTFVTRTALHWISWYQKIYNFTDYVITPSYPMKEIMNSQHLKCNDVWPPTVESKTTFNPSHKSLEMRKKLTFGNPDAPLIIYVGRIAVEKNLELLPKILEVNPTAYLALIGTGDIADEWKARHGAQNRVYCEAQYWHGDDLSQAYASSDIFVLPSNFEALGNVILEAMASGIAAVGCNAGGIPHMIQHRRTGLLFESGDADGLAQAVSELINNPSLRIQLAAEGRKYAEGISWETSAAYVAEIYQRVIDIHKNHLYVPMDGKLPCEPPKSNSLVKKLIVAAAILTLLVLLLFLILSSLS